MKAAPEGVMMKSDADEPKQQDFETLKSIAVAAERQRIKDVLAQIQPGHGELIEVLAFDGKTTGTEAAVAVAAAERALLASFAAAWAADAPAAVPHAAAPDYRQVYAAWQQVHEILKSIDATELQRIKDVLAKSLPGHEVLIEGLAFDGKTTGAEAALAVDAAEIALLESGTSTNVAEQLHVTRHYVHGILMSIDATELQRVKDVLACSRPGHEELIEDLLFDGKTTGSEAAIAVAEADQERQKYEKSSLYKVCKKYAIPSDIEKKLKYVVSDLVCFKTEIQPNTKTPANRATDFKKIETNVKRLKKTIEALPFDDRMALDNVFFGVDEPGFEELFHFANDSKAFDVAERLLPRVENAAQAARKRIKKLSINARHADFIRCIAQILDKAMIDPVYSGKFKEFCEAIFKDAGGFVLSDKAKRYFTEVIRPDLKARGYIR